MFDKRSMLGLCAVLVLVPTCSGRLTVAEHGPGGASGTERDASSPSGTLDAGAGGNTSSGGHTSATANGGAPDGGARSAGGSTATGGATSIGGATASGGANTGGAGGVSTGGAGGASMLGSSGAPAMWMGNVSACQATPPSTDSACPAEGITCGYWSDDGSQYTGCRCVLESATKLGWDCRGNQYSSPACPHDAQPANGSSCFGYKGALCAYPPRMACACDPNALDPRWFCIDPNPVLPGPTASLDTSKPVSGMSDADRQAFCLWFATGWEGPGFPPPPDVPPSSDGTSGNTGCGYGDRAACRAKYPAPLPVSSCTANLALSTCKAPLSELIDCTVTLFNACLPSPHGCGPYLSSPGCSGTIVTEYVPQPQDAGAAGATGVHSTDCAIRVR